MSWEAIVERSKEQDLEDLISGIDMRALNGSITPGFGTPRHSLGLSAGSPDLRNSRHSANGGFFSPTLSATTTAGTPPESPCPAGSTQFADDDTLILSAAATSKAGQSIPSLSLSPPRSATIQTRSSNSATISQLRLHIAALEKQLEQSKAALAESQDISSRAMDKAFQMEGQRDTFRSQRDELDGRCASLKEEKDHAMIQFDQDMSNLETKWQHKLEAKEQKWAEDKSELKRRKKEALAKVEAAQAQDAYRWKKTSAIKCASSHWNLVTSEAEQQLDTIKADRQVLAVLLSSLELHASFVSP